MFTNEDEQNQEAVSPGDCILIDLPLTVSLSVRFLSCNTVLLSIKYTSIELSDGGVYQCVMECELVWFCVTILLDMCSFNFDRPSSR
jgi:hypothetical protein